MGEGARSRGWESAGVGIGSVELGGDGTWEDVGVQHGWCQHVWQWCQKRDKVKVI